MHPGPWQVLMRLLNELVLGAMEARPYLPNLCSSARPSKHLRGEACEIDSRPSATHEWRHPAGGGSAHAARTQVRSQRWAGSASSRGCHSKETENGANGSGSSRGCRPAYKTPV